MASPGASGRRAAEAARYLLSALLVLLTGQCLQGDEAVAAGAEAVDDRPISPGWAAARTRLVTDWTLWPPEVPSQPSESSALPRRCGR